MMEYALCLVKSWNSIYFLQVMEYALCLVKTWSSIHLLQVTEYARFLVKSRSTIHLLQVMEYALCLVTRITVLSMGSFTVSKVPASISWRLTVSDTHSLSVSQTMLGVPERRHGQKLCQSRYRHVSCLSVEEVGLEALSLSKLHT